MADDQLTDLLSQLESDDARERRWAAQQLGKLGNPAAISKLVQVFETDEEDPVKRAAADALRVFRRMQQEESGERSDEEEESVNTVLLKRARTGLLALLGITVVLNLGISLIKPIFSNRPQATPTAIQRDTPSVREDLIKDLQGRVAAIDTEARQMRTLFTAFQVDFQFGRIPRCDALPAPKVTPVNLAPIDMATFPDIAETNNLTNKAATSHVQARADYKTLCEIRDLGQLTGEITRRGGPPALVRRIDMILNEELAAAKAALNRAITNPAPTVPPTPTPTPVTPTPTPTATATLTPAPDATSAKLTPGATSPAGTTAATAGATTAAVAILEEWDANLVALTQYMYKASFRYDGVSRTNQKVQGLLRIDTIYQDSPRVAQYIVVISDDLDMFKEVLGPLYVKGNSTYTIVDNVLYQIGAVVGTRARCEAFKVSDTALGKFKTLSLDGAAPRSDSEEYKRITLIPIGAPAPGNIQRLAGRADRTEGGSAISETLDILTSLDKKLPVRTTYRITRTVPPGTTRTTITELVKTFELVKTDQEVDVSGIKMPLECQGITPK